MGLIRDSALGTASPWSRHHNVGIKLRDSRRNCGNTMSASKHHVAVLGGGLTGLSAAYHLARRYPNVSVTVYEKTSRFGGWVKSERVDVEDEMGNKASVVLEAAPRTLRPNAQSVLELVGTQSYSVECALSSSRSTCSACVTRCS